jgi:hypothetical protein
MNERIKALAEQAGFDVKRLLAPHLGGFPRDDFLALESFAELIVRECVDCLAPLSRNHSIVGAAQDTIKEHFGVE